MEGAVSLRTSEQIEMRVTAAGIGWSIISKRDEQIKSIIDNLDLMELINSFKPSG